VNHALHCEDLCVGLNPTLCAIPAEKLLGEMIRHASGNAMVQSEMSCRGRDQFAMGQFAMSQFVMGHSGMDRVGTDRIAPSPLRCPVDAQTSRREADHPGDSSPAAIHDVHDCRIRILNFHPCGVCRPSGDGHRGWIADHVRDRRNDVQNEDSWGFEALFRRLFGAFETIQ
jgi:hypothetical protein